MSDGGKILSRRVRATVPSKNAGCPLTRNRSVWCYGMCTPRDGLGVCGRVAHHAIKGRTQLAIAAQLLATGECELDLTTLEAPELWCRSGAW